MMIDSWMKGLCILVIDDDETNLASITDTLEEAGMTYQIARNGQEGLEKLQQYATNIKAIILDWMMPVMDGPSFLRRVKQEPAFAHLPVIMQTAKAEQIHIQQGMEEGACHYLTKPYGEMVLLSMLKNALKESRKFEQVQAEQASQVESIRDWATNFIRLERHKVKLNNLGQEVLNDFFMESLDCLDKEGLVECFLEALNKLDFQSTPNFYDTEMDRFLRCSILLHDGEDIDLSDRGVKSKLDNLILEKSMKDNQLIQRGDYSAIPSKSGLLAILIRNTPKDPAERDMAIQFVTMMLEQFEKRYAAFSAAIELKQRNEQMKRIVEKSYNELTKIQDDYQRMKLELLDRMDNLENDLLIQFSGLESSAHEQATQHLGNYVLAVNDLFQKDQITDQQFLITLQELGDIFESPKEDRLVPGKLAGNKQSQIDNLLAEFGL